MMVDHPGSTDARLNGCICPPEQIGPEYIARYDCPVHSLAAVFGEEDRSAWVTISEEGLTATAPTAEAARAMLERMLKRRR